MLEGFGALWADPDVPDRLREEAVADIFTRFDVDGPDLVAIHPAPNENAWLLGQAALRDGSLVMSEDVGLVGARGLALRFPTEIRDRVGYRVRRRGGVVDGPRGVGPTLYG
jgi:hypothetical protein